MELQMGNNDAAITYFQTALEMAEALGEEGAEVATNCRNIIPAVYLSTAKEQIKAKNYDAAVEQLNKAIEAAEKYENADVTADANELMPQVYVSKGNDFLTAKNFAEAEVAYNKAIELDAANGMAYFRLGQALASQNKTAEAEAAYVKAAENGQEKNAYKQLSNMYVKLAQASNKAKKYEGVLDYAAKSNQYLENANAYRFAAGAAQQLGKNADCIANYEKYLELSPNAKDAGGVKFTIAALYQQAGDKAKAKEYYQAVATDPQYGASAQEQLKTL
jgi:tetratricopeptide (TPR) repeat protein